MQTEQTSEPPLNGYEKRRRAISSRILEVTANMIRESGDTKMSTRSIAEKAGVSLATPFNHFKSKQGILSAIIEESLSNDFYVQNAEQKKARSVLDILINTSFHYINDEALFRPLFQSVLTQTPGTSRPSFQQALSAIEKQLEYDKSNGSLVSNVNLRILAEQLETYWLGSMILWCSKTIDSEDWINRIRPVSYTHLTLPTIYSV